MALKRAVICWKCPHRVGNLGTLSTDAAGELDVLWHDGDTFGVDGAQVGVLEETDQVGLAEASCRAMTAGALESQIGLEVLGDFTHKTLEGQLPDQKLGALLVTTDLTESDGSWPVTVWFLHSAGGGCALTSGLGGQLFSVVPFHRWIYVRSALYVP